MLLDDGLQNDWALRIDIYQFTSNKQTITSCHLAVWCLKIAGSASQLHSIST